LIGFDSGYFAHNLTGTSRLPETLLDRLHFGDVRDFPPNLLDGVDAVVHLAAIANDPMEKEFEAVTEAINKNASIELAQERGVSTFVFASSGSMHGAAEGGPRRESDPLIR
jgi:nucleoside-diphosphate-sugar epimerase